MKPKLHKKLISKDTFIHMLVCGKCGAELTEKQRRCSNCGERVDYNKSIDKPKEDLNMNEVGEFRKREIQNIRYYNNVIHGFNLKIEEVDNILTGVRGIDPSKEPGTGNGGKLDRNKLIERKNKYVYERAVYQRRVDDIMRFLDSLHEKDKWMLVDVYGKNLVWDNVAFENHISRRTLARHIKKILEEM